MQIIPSIFPRNLTRFGPEPLVHLNTNRASLRCQKDQIIHEIFNMDHRRICAEVCRGEWSKLQLWVFTSSRTAFLLSKHSCVTDSEEQKENFTKNPEEYLKYRKAVEAELNQRFKFVCELKSKSIIRCSCSVPDHQWYSRAERSAGGK